MTTRHVLLIWLALSASADVAFAQSAAPARADWSRVMSLRPGRPIDLATTTGIDGQRHFVAADGRELIVLNLAYPGLSGADRDRLRELATDQPATLLAARGSRIVEHQGIRLGPDGIFAGGRRITDVSRILQTVPRQEVRRISERRTRGSRMGAAVGGAAGFLGAMYIAPHFIFKQCGKSCSDEKFMIGASFVGLPVGGALLGYRGNAAIVTIYESRTGQFGINP